MRIIKKVSAALAAVSVFLASVDQTLTDGNLIVDRIRKPYYIHLRGIDQEIVYTYVNNKPDKLINLVAENSNIDYKSAFFAYEKSLIQDAKDDNVKISEKEKAIAVASILYLYAIMGEEERSLWSDTMPSGELSFDIEAAMSAGWFLYSKAAEYERLHGTDNCSNMCPKETLLTFAYHVLKKAKGERVPHVIETETLKGAIQQGLRNKEKAEIHYENASNLIINGNKIFLVEEDPESARGYAHRGASLVMLVSIDAVDREKKIETLNEAIEFLNVTIRHRKTLFDDVCGDNKESCNSVEELNLLKALFARTYRLRGLAYNYINRLSSGCNEVLEKKVRDDYTESLNFNRNSLATFSLLEKLERDRSDLDNIELDCDSII